MSDDMMIGRSSEKIPPEAISKHFANSARFMRLHTASERTIAHVNQSTARPKTEGIQKEEVLHTLTSIGEISEEVLGFFSAEARSTLALAITSHLSQHAKKAYAAELNALAKHHDELVRSLRKVEIVLLLKETQNSD